MLDVSTWAPGVGMVLRHSAIDQRVEVLSRMQFADMMFWEIVIQSHSSILEEKSWLIHEPALLDQYRPVPNRP